MLEGIDLSKERTVAQKDSSRRWLAGAVSVVAVVAASLGSGALAHAAPAGRISSHAPTASPSVVHQSRTYCDGSGDSRPADDCIRHLVLLNATHGHVPGGHRYAMAVTTHPGLRHLPLIADVQYRSVSPSGQLGNWWTHRHVLLRSSTKQPDIHVITACAPVRTGVYQVRTAVTVPLVRTLSARAGALPPVVITDASPSSSAASASSGTSSSASPSASSSATASASGSASGSASASVSPTPSRSASPSGTATPSAAAPVVPTDVVTSAPTTLTVTPGESGCSDQAANELNIEYFNEMNFMSDYTVSLIPSATGTSVTLNCPSAGMPAPSTLVVTMATADGSQSTTCNGAPILVATASSAPAFCTTSGWNCEFSITAFNSDTSTIYSQTQVQFVLPTGLPVTDVPNLNAATLPICPQTINACVLTGTCTLSTTKNGALTLCDSADYSVCTPPPTNNTYSYNQNVYFQSSITNRVT